MQHMIAKYMSLPCRKGGGGLPPADRYYGTQGEAMSASRRRREAEKQRWEGMKASERYRVREKQESGNTGSTLTKEQALGVLATYAKSIYFDDVFHRLRVDCVPNAEDRVRVGNALMALGSERYSEGEEAVCAVGSEENQWVVAENIRAGGITFQGMPHLPIQSGRDGQGR